MTSEEKRQVRTRRLVSLSREWWVAEVRGYGQTEQEALQDVQAQVWKVYENPPHTKVDQETRDMFTWEYQR